jgi:protease-4
MISRLRQARGRQGRARVLITLGAGASVNFAQSAGDSRHLVELRRAGKKTFVYRRLVRHDQLLRFASGATNVCMLAGGEIMIPGVGLETMYYKGTFDKIGVLADYVQIGEYKGAEEPYTRTAASDELRGELTKLTEGMYDQM